MYKYNSSSFFNIKKRKLNYSLKKLKCIQLEKEIFSFINQIRRDPSKIIEMLKDVQKNPNYNINFETHQIFSYINILNENNISLPPLIDKKELTIIAYELLNYLISVKKYKGKINYNNLDEDYLNLRLRASPYVRIRGKYYEAIVLDTTNLLEIISYIMRDIKGRNVLFNEKIKYIGIACGYFENINNENNFHYKSSRNKICTIIDMVQDFEINTLENYNIEYDNSLKERYRNKTPEIFTKIKTVFKDNDYNINKEENNEGNLNFERKTKSSDKLKKNRLLTNKNFIDNNKSHQKKKIVVNKSPLLKNDKKISSTFSSNFYLGKSNTSRIIRPFKSFKSKIQNQKLSSFNNNRNNTLYYSSQNKLNKEKENQKKNLINFSEKNETNSASFSMTKSPKRVLNHEEKMELLKQINKASRDKNNKIHKSKSNIKYDDDSKSISFKSKKNISNDISFSELISVENDKKVKEKEMKTLLKNQIKKEIKNEIEKELKEELKAELVNNLLSSTNRHYKKKLPPLKIPLNNNINNNTSFNFETLNNTSPKQFKYNEINTNRSISSIDILLPKNKGISTTINTNENINYNNKDNIIIKKLVKLYNNVINKGERGEKSFDKKISLNNTNNNIYYKIPILNNTFYYNKKEQNNIYNNKPNINQKITNKIIKLNNKNLINFHSNSPKGRSKISQIPFKKIIVKNNNNIKNMNKVKKEPIKDINYIDNKNIIINNKTNNIVYIKQISPNKNKNFKEQKIFDNKIK